MDDSRQKDLIRVLTGAIESATVENWGAVRVALDTAKRILDEIEGR